jgi:membrane fusion protein (multidrug efflux system)
MPCQRTASPEQAQSVHAFIRQHIAKRNADIAENYLPVIHKGDKVELNFPTFPELSMNVSIYRIGNIIHPQNRTVNIQLQINNQNEMLKPNGLAIIQINDFSSEEAFVVPSIIIKQDMKGSFLYVVNQVNNQLVSQKRYVNPGISFKDQTMIVEGLKLGDKVVVEGYNQISDGSEIEIK